MPGIFVGGTPPRRRGPLYEPRIAGGERRFTPAAAGTTGTTPWSVRPPPVHPRVGGDHAPDKVFNQMKDGSPLRRRGARRPQGRRAGAQRSPPRWRGPQRVRLELGEGRRFTPASAETTRRCPTAGDRQAAHPGVGGDHLLLALVAVLNTGSPPRRRGPPGSLRRRVDAQRNTLASAGTTSRRPAQCPCWSVHPHVSGDHECYYGDTKHPFGSPQRRRGARHLLIEVPPHVQFTPASAETTTGLRLQPAGPTAHAHVGGDRDSYGTTFRPGVGSPSRRRGPPVDARTIWKVVGSPLRQWEALVELGIHAASGRITPASAEA